MDAAVWQQFRAAMWWLVGYSNGKSGEELANPQMLDQQYQEDYDRGLAHGKSDWPPAEPTYGGF